MAEEIDFSLFRKPENKNLRDTRHRKPKTQCKKLHAFYPWVGGKFFIKGWLSTQTPSEYKTYFEPFLGAGSLFLELKPQKAVINDLNPYLPLMFYCVKSHLRMFTAQLDLLVTSLDRLGGPGFEQGLKRFNTNAKEARNKIPSNFSIARENVEELVSRAALFFYLLKRCHNGNISLLADGTIKCSYWKARQHMKLYNPALLQAIHNYMDNADIRIFHGDFSKILKLCKKGDFVYMDPPYYGSQMKSTLWAYDSKPMDHELLIAQAHRLTESGVHFAMTNNYVQDVVDQFQDYNIIHMRNVRGWSQCEKGPLKRSDMLVTNYG